MTREQRAGWLADHLVAASILLGLGWGVPMFLFFGARQGFSHPGWLLASSLGAGLLCFGPSVALLNRRAVRRRSGDLESGDEPRVQNQAAE